MSRSYKRNSVYKPHAQKKAKRASSKKIRRSSWHVPQNGKGYKKIFESWNIRDYRTWESLRNHLKNWSLYFDSREEAVQYWKNITEESRNCYENTYRNGCRRNWKKGVFITPVS